MHTVTYETHCGRFPAFRSADAVRFIDLLSKIIVINKAQDEFDSVEQSMHVDEIVTRTLDTLTEYCVDNLEAYTHVSIEECS